MVGIRDACSAHLRRFEHSLQATPRPERMTATRSQMLRGLRDLLPASARTGRTPPNTPNLCSRCPRVQRWFAKAPSRRLAADARVRSPPRAAGGDRPRVSPSTVCRCCRYSRCRERPDRPHGTAPGVGGRRSASAYRALAALVTQAIGGAAPISDRDIAFWTAEPACRCAIAPCTGSSPPSQRRRCACQPRHHQRYAAA